jgi:hypothetical protein
LLEQIDQPRHSRGGEQELMQSTLHIANSAFMPTGAGVFQRPLLLAR